MKTYSGYSIQGRGVGNDGFGITQPYAFLYPVEHPVSGSYLAGKTYLSDGNAAEGHRFTKRRAGYRKSKGKVSAPVINSDTSDSIDVYIFVTQSHACTAFKNCKQQHESAGIYACSHSPRVCKRGAGEQGLDLDQNRSITLHDTCH